MKYATQNIVLTLLACLLLWSGSAMLVAAAENLPFAETSTETLIQDEEVAIEHILEERICETVEQLIVALEEDQGGAIRLSGDGPFMLTESAIIEVTQPVTVYLPPGGIDLTGWGSVVIRGPITFIGTQGFAVYDHITLSLYEGVNIQMSAGIAGEAPIAVSLHEANRLDADATVTISAQGGNATAVFAEDGGVFVLSGAQISAVGHGATAILNYGDLVVDQGSIRAEGNDSYAVFSSGELIMSQVDVQAEGQNSCAIYNEGPVELYRAKVTGTVAADAVYAAFSHFSPPPPNLIEVPAEPDMIPLKTVVYQDLACGTAPVEFPDRIAYTYSYPPPNPDNWFRSSFDVDCLASWDLNGLDYSVPGTYNATATLEPILPAPGLSVPPFTHEITVMPLDRAALYGGWGFGPYVAVQCLAPIRDAENLLFWVYEGADGWRELTASGHAVYAEEWSPALHPNFEDGIDYPIFQVSGLEVDRHYWVMAQVVGGPMAGDSNLWQMYTGTQKGGDRTGTDRFGAKPTTLPPAPSTETESPEDKDAKETTTGRTSSGRKDTTAAIADIFPPLVVEVSALPQEIPHSSTTPHPDLSVNEQTTEIAAANNPKEDQSAAKGTLLEASKTAPDVNSVTATVSAPDKGSDESELIEDQQSSPPSNTLTSAQEPSNHAPTILTAREMANSSASRNILAIFSVLTLSAGGLLIGRYLLRRRSG